jgi:hypothetical protein
VPKFCKVFRRRQRWTEVGQSVGTIPSGGDNGSEKSAKSRTPASEKAEIIETLGQGKRVTGEES